MNSNLRFSLIIPVFNKWALTANCLRSIKEHTPEIPFEVIVVDNASSDETATELLPLGEQLFGSLFQHIRYEENRNFGPACNAGAKAASSPIVFFLNNDTLVTPGWAPPMLEALDSDSGLGGVGPLLLYDDDTVQHLGVVFSIFGVEHLYRHFPADHPAVKKRRKFQVISGAAIMLRRTLFLEHGGFFEEYKNSFEDVDLCLRIHSTGLKFSTIPESVVYHLESQTPGRRKHDTANGELLSKRCGNLFHVDLHRFGLDDGFEPFVNDFYELGMVHARAESEELMRYAEGKPVSVWQDLLRANPYWSRGREYLAGRLEEGGHYNEALELRTNLAGMLGSEQAYKKFIRCAIRANNISMQRKAEHYLRMLLNCKLNKNVAEGLAAKAIELAERFQDAYLAGLYRERLGDADK